MSNMIVDDAEVSNTDSPLIVCPKCEALFTPKRSNQQYCMPSCQKTATRNTSRGTRKAELKADSEKHFERVNRLFEMLYSVPVNERLGVMQGIFSHVPTDAGLRRILTDPNLLSATPRADGRKNIAKAAHAYTQKFFGVSIKAYVEQAMKGSLNEFHPVTPSPVDHGPVPRLKQMRKVKCWHCRDEARDQAQAADHAQSLRADLDRLTAVVEAAQAKVDAWNGDRRNVIPEQPSDSALEADLNIPTSALEADLNNPQTSQRR